MNQKDKYRSENNELYLKIFDDFPALIWRSGLDKLCDYFNNTWLEFTGRTFEQEYGNGWVEGVHPDDVSCCFETYVTAFDKREPFTMDYRLKNKYGEYRWIRDFGRPFVDFDNNFLGYIGSCYDITITKEYEKQLLEINEAKDKFFSIISHDLRSPFLGFLGLTEVLAKDISTMEQKDIVTYAEVLFSTAGRIYSLLNNLLDWSRIQTGTMNFSASETDLYEQVTKAIDLMEVRIREKSIIVKNEIAEGSILLTDTHMFATVLRNLISNALKFTPPCGHITISSEKTKDHIEISVSDTGIGISEENIDKLFRIDTKYIRTGTSGEQGSGIGLLLCKELVSKMGGSIELKSQPHIKTTFSIKLPLNTGEKPILIN